MIATNIIPTMELPNVQAMRNLTIKETEAVLKVRRTKIYELINSGRLRSMKIDGARRVPVTAVEEFIAAQNSAGASV